MNTDVKILKKMSANQIQQHIKRPYAMTKWDSFQVHKDSSIYVNQCDKQHKEKNHIIISIDAQKAFDKIRHPFMIKTLIKVVMKGTYLTSYLLQTHSQYNTQW